MTNEMKNMLLGVIRHVLTTIGGSLVATGVISMDQMNQAVGGILVIIGIIWSLANKRQRIA